MAGSVGEAPLDEADVVLFDGAVARGEELRRGDVQVGEGVDDPVQFVGLGGRSQEASFVSKAFFQVTGEAAEFGAVEVAERGELPAGFGVQGEVAQHEFVAAEGGEQQPPLFLREACGEGGGEPRGESRALFAAGGLQQRSEGQGAQGNAEGLRGSLDVGRGRRAETKDAVGTEGVAANRGEEGGVGMVEGKADPVGFVLADGFRDAVPQGLEETLGVLFVFVGQGSRARRASEIDDAVARFEAGKLAENIARGQVDAGAAAVQFPVGQADGARADEGRLVRLSLPQEPAGLFLLRLPLPGLGREKNAKVAVLVHGAVVIPDGRADAPPADVEEIAVLQLGDRPLPQHKGAQTVVVLLLFPRFGRHDGAEQKGRLAELLAQGVERGLRLDLEGASLAEVSHVGAAEGGGGGDDETGAVVEAFAVALDDGAKIAREVARDGGVLDDADFEALFHGGAVRRSAECLQRYWEGSMRSWRMR